MSSNVLFANTLLIACCAGVTGLLADPAAPVCVRELPHPSAVLSLAFLRSGFLVPEGLGEGEALRVVLMGMCR